MRSKLNMNFKTNNNSVFRAGHSHRSERKTKNFQFGRKCNHPDPFRVANPQSLSQFSTREKSCRSWTIGMNRRSQRSTDSMRHCRVLSVGESIVWISPDGQRIVISLTVAFKGIPKCTSGLDVDA